MARQDRSARQAKQPQPTQTTQRAPSEEERSEGLSPSATLPTFPTELIPIDALSAHPRNYVAHPDDELEHIMASIREHGFYRNVVISSDDVILAGHAVTEAAAQMGYSAVPAIRVPYTHDDPRALKLLISDNEIRHLAEVDDRALTNLLRDLTESVELLGTGYDEMMLATLAMVTRPAHEVADLDAAAHWVGMPEYDQTGETRLQVILNFASEADRVKACALLGLDATTIPTEGARKSVWWPPRERRWDDNTSIRFVDAAHGPERAETAGEER